MAVVAAEGGERRELAEDVGYRLRVLRQPLVNQV